MTPLRWWQSGLTLLRREALWLPALAFLASRLPLLLAAVVAEVALPSREGAALWLARSDHPWLDVWARWDSSFYLTIVDSGYRFVPGEQSNVAFFPLYPLLTDLLASLVGDPVLAGVLLSHLAFLAALVVLYLLTELEFDRGTARRTVFYLACFPTAFFFSALYTESLYLLLAVASFYAARRRHWAWAGMLAMLTSATRIPGLVVWGALVLEWLRYHGWTLGRLHTAAAWRALGRALRVDLASFGWLLLGPLGLVSYMIFLHRNVGDALAFWTVQAAWGRESLGPVAVVLRDVGKLMEQLAAGGDIWWNVGFDVAALLVGVVLSWFIWRRLGASFALFTALGVLIPAWSGTGSLSRYLLVLFPLFMVAGRWLRGQAIERAVLIALSIFLGVFTTIFVTGVFVA